MSLFLMVLLGLISCDFGPETIDAPQKTPSKYAEDMDFPRSEEEEKSQWNDMVKVGSFDPEGLDDSIKLTFADNVAKEKSTIHSPDGLTQDGIEPYGLTWTVLQKVEFIDKFNEEEEAWYWYPNFDSSVRALEGLDVSISGYVIPVDLGDEDIYVLSAYPNSQCFFCGKAGQESVMALNLAPGHRKFKVDDFVTFKGTFQLNSEDVYELNYILEYAEEVD